MGELCQRTQSPISLQLRRRSLPARPCLPNGDGGIVSNSGLEARPVRHLAQLQAIYDGAPVGLCFPTVFATSVSIVVSPISRAPRWRTILDETVKEIISEIYPSVEPYLLRALQGESIKEVEVSWPASEHSEPMRTDLISYQPAFDEAREVIGVSVVVVDITEHKRTEEALRESEDHSDILWSSIRKLRGSWMPMAATWT